MIRVALIGATGYTALESARLLLRHPEAEITVVTSRQEAGMSLAEIHPSLSGRVNLQLENFDAEEIAARADVAFSCLPHGASAATVRELADAGTRVIDFSADFRLGSVDLYQRWYGVEHPWPEMIGRVPYGLPEVFASQLVDCPIIANPGCYPTSAILPLAPLLEAHMIAAGDIIIDSKSGVSGAGRTPKVNTMYCEANESISAYSVGSHRHGPEIIDICHRLSGELPQIIFTPHLTPMDRGILSTIYVRSDAGPDAILQRLRSAYEGCPFVRVVDHLPATRHVSGTNFCDIAVRASGDRVILLSAIDNLIKGAAGAAVQNMNCMFGMPQTMGLC